MKILWYNSNITLVLRRYIYNEKIFLFGIDNISSASSHYSLWDTIFFYEKDGHDEVCTVY